MSSNDPRQNGHFIDDESPLESSEEDDEDDEIDEEYDDDRVEDEDWEVAEGDFTKQFNRLRQHVAVRSGNAQGITSSINSKDSLASLPAVNHPKKSTSTSTPKDKTTDQLAALVKYSSRIAQIDQPYAHIMGVGVNRKGPSAHANVKDKSDRATNEQVLDPRTRIILFKMIGRELIHEVNGCVSTGKEVSSFSLDRDLIIILTCFLGKCISCPHPHPYPSRSQNIQNLHPSIQRPRSIRLRRTPFSSWIQQT